MNQPNVHVSSINPSARIDKNFVFNGTKYPINFSLVKMYSNYFYENRSKFKSVVDIEIKCDEYEITDESIPMFVSCCQNKPFDINGSNIFSLHQLSIQYDVPVLRDLTSHYIAKNQKSLIFKSIIYKLKNQKAGSNIDLGAEEDMIASNFFEFIDNKELISLPVPILNRIISKEHLNFKSMELTKQGQFIEFLYKCLDEHKREASILFLNLDIENEHIGILAHLNNRYSDVFDFNFINSKYLAKNASNLMSEMEKLKIEFNDKLREIEAENERQKNFFISAQNSFNEQKRDLLDSNRLLEDRVRELERKLSLIEEKQNEQSAVTDRYKNVKVREIEIEADSKIVVPGSTIKLAAFVTPQHAFNDGVDWNIVEDEAGSVRVESKDQKSIVLKCIKPKNVTVFASALDGSGVEARKELMHEPLKGKIEVELPRNQTIKGKIEIKEEDGGAKLDTDRSKFLLNSAGDAILGSAAYESGSKLDALVKEFSFTQLAIGDNFVHALIFDNFGLSQELVSQGVRINELCFDYTGRVQPVDLQPGVYRLEAWGAQGGSLDSEFYGGYGGYSAGTISLSSRTTLYVVVGKSTSSESGGYNGGGSGGVLSSGYYTFTSYGGGGASHIGLKSGELASFSGDYSTSLLIAAGGGGGAVGTTHQSAKHYNSIGGSGGGATGADGNSDCGSNHIGTGATQSQGGTNSYWNGQGGFGHGSNCEKHPSYYEGGGGGGGFYGGGSGGNAGSGGGGSGFINTSKLSDAFMCGYNVKESSAVESKTVSTSNKSSSAISEYAKLNDGYVKITQL